MKVAHQITKEALHHHASKRDAMRRGKLAGEAAVKFAASLVDKKMKAVVGHKEANRIIHRAIVKAFHRVHRAARH